MYRQIGRFSKHWQRPRDGSDNGPHGQMKLTFFGRCEQYTIDARILKTYCSIDIRDCAIIIRGGLKNERGVLHKITAKIGGAQSKITHLTEGGPKLFAIKDSQYIHHDRL